MDVHTGAHQSKTSAHSMGRRHAQWAAIRHSNGLPRTSARLACEKLFSQEFDEHSLQNKPYRRLAFVPLNLTLHFPILNRNNFLEKRIGVCFRTWIIISSARCSFNDNPPSPWFRYSRDLMEYLYTYLTSAVSSRTLLPQCPHWR